MLRNYNRGRFPGVPRLQDFAAEEVARQVDASPWDIEGDRELYHQAVTDPSARNALFASRAKTLSNHARRRDMAENRHRFRNDLAEEMRMPREPWTAQQLQAHREHLDDVLSDEAIDHATLGQLPQNIRNPSMLRVQTPVERMDAMHLPDWMPAGFTTFIRDRLGLDVQGMDLQQTFLQFRSKFHIPYEAFEALLSQLWREWSGRRPGQ